MDLQQSIQNTKLYIKTPRTKTPEAFQLMPVDFINLINSGAKKINLNNETYKDGELILQHQATYDGITIKSKTQQYIIKI